MDISTIHLEATTHPLQSRSTPLPGASSVPCRTISTASSCATARTLGLAGLRTSSPGTGFHGVWIADGAARYRNRYVRTPLYADPSTPRDGRYVTTANTHVIHHGGQLLALEEGGLPYALDLQLETHGPFDFDGRLRSAMTAHPKRCPLSGELLFFGYGVVPPYLTYHRVGDDGVLQSACMEVDRPMMLHDFAVTSTRTIFVESPWVFDIATCATTPKRNSTSSPIASTVGLDQTSTGGHHLKHSTRRCVDRLTPQHSGATRWHFGNR